ncbi:MAG TPA: Hsp20/alpha crystallin family protein [Thermoplasmata archaeon]|nr:Hsp20/alpha crystallin family protein [Thermoplasmata archaeon]
MGTTDDVDHLRKNLDRMLRDAFRERQGAFQEPFIYGFTVRSLPERRDIPHRVRIEAPEERPAEVCAEIVETESHLYVTMELSGQAEAPAVSVRGRRLLVQGKGMPLSVELPDEAAEGAESVSLRNGVVDIVLRRSSARPTLRIG